MSGGNGWAHRPGSVLAIALLVVAGASAAPRPDVPLAMPPGSTQPSLVLPQAEDEALKRIIATVERRYNARVVRVTEVSVDGRRAYDLRLLSEQRVWMIRVDAATGQELPRQD